MTKGVNSEEFFEGLEGFSDFADLVDEKNYLPVPSDWWVVVSDVMGSTRAIEAGRYKDVNTVGAATIAVIQTALGGQGFPFVFGGDGSTSLVPDSRRQLVAEHLHALRCIARDNFKLRLRVGMVQVSELNARGCPVLLSKFTINEASSLAMFGGGGITLAEELVKSSEGYDVPELERKDTDLGQLSCRWEPLKPQRGVVLSLLVRLQDGVDKGLYRAILRELAAIVGGLEGANPVSAAAMRYRTLADLWRHDKLHQRSLLLRFKRMALSVVAVLLFRTGLYRRLSKIRHYVAATASHSDFRKFDDMLRMVIDCTETQAEAIERFLMEQHAAEKIVFGLHRSNAALMTCYVQGFGDGDHLHFIDGTDGGYAVAAKQLKAQLKQSSSS